MLRTDMPARIDAAGTEIIASFRKAKARMDTGFRWTGLMVTTLLAVLGLLIRSLAQI